MSLICCFLVLTSSYHLFSPSPLSCLALILLSHLLLLHFGFHSFVTLSLSLFSLACFFFSFINACFCSLSPSHFSLSLFDGFSLCLSSLSPFFSLLYTVTTRGVRCSSFQRPLLFLFCLLSLSSHCCSLFPISFLCLSSVSCPSLLFFSSPDLYNQRVVRADIDRTRPTVERFQSLVLKHDMETILTLYCKLHNLSYKQGEAFFSFSTSLVSNSST